MYVAVKGGERAIDNAHDSLAEQRRGDTDVATLDTAQIREQLRLAVDRVMAEGSLYDPDLAALAIKQARGDLIEAIFLVRAYRTTLPRLGVAHEREIQQPARVIKRRAHHPPACHTFKRRCYPPPTLHRHGIRPD